MPLAKEEAPASWTGALPNETAAQPLQAPILANARHQETLRAALELSASGVSVIPIRADGSKATLGKWNQAQERRAEPAQLTQQFANAALGVAAVMGAVSGNLLMVEIEGRARHRLADLEQLAEASGLGELWRRICAGWMEESPSGGVHWFIRTPAPFPSRKLAQAADKACLAETKGEGGYCIVAPSGGTVHPTGKPWMLLAGGPSTAYAVTEEELEQFLALFSILDERPATPTPERIQRPAYSGPGISPGDDYENRTPWADILHGWTVVYTQGHTTYWRRPGKATGISATTGRAEDRDRLYVFTSSTEFEPETPVGKFAAYALLNHGGDFSAAAAQLRRDGYGGALPDRDTAADGLQGLVADWTPQRVQELADIEQTVTGGEPPPVSGDNYSRAVAERLLQLRVQDDAARMFRQQRDGGTGASPELVKLAALLDEPDESEDYRVDSLWPTGGRVVLAAQYKAGKSTAVGNVLRSLADGADLFGRYKTGQAARVVLIDNELHRKTLRRWLRGQGIGNVDAVELVPLRGRVSEFDILDPAVRAEWARLIQGADVVILDCLRPVLDALGLSEDKDAGRFLVAFDALLEGAGIGEAMVVHHMGHNGERSRGDSRILDWPDATWKIVKQDQDNQSGPRYFSAFGRDVDVPEAGLAFDETTRHLTLTEATRKEASAEEALPAVLAALAGNNALSGRQVEEALKGSGHTRRQIHAALTLAHNRKLLVTYEGARRAIMHSLTPSAPSAP